MTTSIPSLAVKRPLVLITGVFIVWKTFLLTIALACPGIGYDTSASLLEAVSQKELLQLPDSLSPSSKFVRWDAFYYIQASRCGLVFEQQWAFGKGLSTLISTFAGAVLGNDSEHGLNSYVAVAMILSHVSHYLSTIFLWMIANDVERETRFQVAFVPITSAILHILSPAGIFLTAPYSESVFSFLNMLGYWFYLRGRSFQMTPKSLSALASTVCAGTSFGIATMIRANGVLSGLPFLLDAVVASRELLLVDRDMNSRISRIVSLASIVLAGSLVALGLTLPQVLAYFEYCTALDETRSWCRNTFPLIYSFVQSHYWNVGFLRYWTLSNLPLFLIALPCLFLLLRSGIAAFDNSGGSKTVWSPQQVIIQRLALPQMVLAILAITNYHVQIITRLASGCSWWYIWLALQQGNSRISEGAVRFFVLYSLIQTTLFASFLPPA